MDPEVVCVGASCLDITLTGVEWKEKFGDDYGLADEVTYCVGGDAMNEAVTLAKLGRQVYYMGRVGDDMAGRFILEQGTEFGIHMDRVTVDPSCQTYNPVAIVGENDKRSFCWKRENTSNARICIEDVDFNVIKKAKVLSFGSIFIVPGFSEPDLVKLFSVAKENGVTVFADVCPGGEDDFSRVSGALKYVDYFFPNFDEARELTGKTDMDEVADALLQYGIQTVVLKLGKQGCYIKNSLGGQLVSAYTVKTVNSTGAGDNFLAGFIDAYLNGCSDRECAEYGAALAALTVQAFGASTGVKNREQVNTFIATHILNGI